MIERDFLKDLKRCELCEHRCRVNRLEGETGVCKVTMPTVASATLHPVLFKKFRGLVKAQAKDEMT